jgi:non-canonical poly(A) RNA polymerase PAPD5/7
VKLIRKARVDDSATKAAASTEAEDFISFDLGDSSADEGDGMDAEVQTFGATNTAKLQRAVDPPAPPSSLSHPPPPPPPPTSLPLHTLPPKPPLPPAAMSATLGTRKRTADDRIKPPNYGPLKKTQRKPSKGAMLAEWEPIEGEDACPWATTDHSATVRMGVW